MVRLWTPEELWDLVFEDPELVINYVEYVASKGAITTDYLDIYTEARSRVPDYYSKGDF